MAIENSSIQRWPVEDLLPVVDRVVEQRTEFRDGLPPPLVDRLDGLRTQQRLVAACNTAFLKLFAYELDELKGQSIAALYPSQQDFHRIGKRGYPQMAFNGTYHDERLMRCRDGKLIWCSVHGRAVDIAAPAAAAVWSFQPVAQSVPEMSLSPREREIVTKLAQGLTSKEMARELDLSPRTVEAYRAKLLQKMGVRTTLQLLAKLV